MIRFFSHVLPIYQKETVTSSRTTRLTVIVLIFNLILALVGLLQLQMTVRDSSYYGSVPYASLLQMYTLVAAFEAAFILFIVPALTAGSISGERERQTLDLLLCTRLRPIDIIVGKLLSCLSTAFVLMLSSLPVLALVYIYGGISVLDLAVLFGCLTVTTLFIGSVSILFSALMKRTTMATVLSYLAVIFVTAGTYLILVMILNIYNVLTPNGVAVTEAVMAPWNHLLLINPAVTFYSLFSQQIGGTDAISIMNWYNTFIFTDRILTADWILLSCAVQLVLAFLFIWLAAYLINPMHKKG